MRSNTHTHTQAQSLRSSIIISLGKSSLQVVSPAEIQRSFEEKLADVESVKESHINQSESFTDRRIYARLFE